MIFAAASSRKRILRDFSKVLISAFPGSTVYELPDDIEMLDCVRSHKIDAAFIDGVSDSENDFRLLGLLKKEKTELPVYVFSDDDALEGDAIWNEAAGYLVRPITAETLRGIIPAE